MRVSADTGGARDAPAWKAEIEDLHRIFEGWIGGDAPPPVEAFARVEAALAEDFTFVTTGGVVLDRGAVLRGIRDARGARPGLRISVRDPRLIHASDHALVAVYEEWQEAGAERSARVSTAVFRPGREAAHGLVWVHVHETWMEEGIGTDAGPARRAGGPIPGASHA